MNRIKLTGIFLLLACYALSAQGAFYYYQGRKLFLSEEKGKILIKLSKTASTAKLLNTIREDSSVKMASPAGADDSNVQFIVLESKDNKNIPAQTLERYQKNPDVSCASPMLRYKNRTQGLTDEFIVKLKQGTSLDQLQKIAKENNCTIVNENPFVKNQFLLSVSRASTLNSLQLANLFYETGLFEFSEPNFYLENIFQSNDPLFYQQWAIKNTGQYSGTPGADAKVEQAWLITLGSPQINIAVIDDGAELTHPDLQANLAPGYDATGLGSGGNPGINLGHGTACAGIIGAVKDNGIGVSGVAPKCKVVPVRTVNNWGSTAQWVADGIEWAWNPLFGKADVLSNSWACSPTNAITNAIDNATKFGRGGLGCLVFFSAGNTSTPVEYEYPAYLPNVIAVGATSMCDQRKSASDDPEGVSCDGVTNWGSCFGKDLDIAAPGVKISTTDLAGSMGYSSTEYFDAFGGTSASCPYAAGIGGLIFSVNPTLSMEQARYVLESTCDKVGKYNYQYVPAQPNGSWSNELGYGRVNAKAAVELARWLLPANLQSHCNNGILDADETNIDCGGADCPACGGLGLCTAGGFANSIFEPSPDCATIQFTINGRPTNDIVNVCKSDIKLAPFKYSAACGSNSKWMFRANNSDKLCSQTSNMWQAASKIYDGILGNKCNCWWLRLFIGIQECDQNKNPIAGEINEWLYFFDNDQSVMTEVNSLKEFDLKDYLPSGASLQEGKYYKVKVASYTNGDEGGPWCEHVGYIRIYADNVMLQNQTITNNQFGNNISIINATVPAIPNLKFIAKTRIEILPQSTLDGGTYEIRNFNCNQLDQFGQ